MLGLLISTILTSAADSLNPIAITQQFVLQGLVKKPKHIWFFIIPTGVVNLISGFLAYYGLVTFIGAFFGKLIIKYGQILFVSELILGIVFIASIGFLVQNNKLVSLKKQLKALTSEEHNDNDEKDDEEKAKLKIKSVSPAALVILGVGATISELTTALPYFAFLSILFNYQLSFIQVSFILVLYNTIYTLPLMILYFIYIKSQNNFDRFYSVIKKHITKWSNIFVPSLMGIIGFILVCHSLLALLK